MKHVLLSMILICLACVVRAQMGNQWIDYSKTYYKFTVDGDGVYRISYDALQEAGLSGIEAGSVRLYRMGEEVPVYISTDGALGDGDFIEFFGEKNRGELDRALYADPDAMQLNPRYSMFSDAAAYFLTTNDNGEGQRVDAVVNDLNNVPPAEQYYMHREEIVYSDGTLVPRIDGSSSYSHYVLGEGFGSNDLKDFTLALDTDGLQASAEDSARLLVRLTTSNRVIHSLEATFNDSLFYQEESMSHYSIRDLTYSVAPGELGSGAELFIKNLAASGKFRLAFIDWEYPHTFDMSGSTSARFTHSGGEERTYYELADFEHGGDAPVVYNITNHTRLVAAIDGSSIRFALPGEVGDYDLQISAVSSVHEVPSLVKTTFQDWSWDNTEYIIISHPRMRTGEDVIQQYLDYRSSGPGGSFRSEYYSILDIYDQFGYGIPNHPQALRNFTAFMDANWPDAQMIFIIGKGLEYSLARNCENDCDGWFNVPTFGIPGSDNLLFALYGGNVSRYPVGRLPALNQDEVATYLAKVREHDMVSELPQTVEDKAWTKNILHLGGGADSDQQEDILGYLNEMGGKLVDSPFGAEVTTFTKSSTDATGTTNSERILKLLEEGTSMVKFFGHSSASTLDFQINNPSDWNNKGKYPVFSAMGCKAGQIHRSFRSLSEIFIFAPEAGSIAFLAGSGNQYLQSLGDWGVEWYRYIGSELEHVRLGGSVRSSLIPFSGSSFTRNLLVEQQTLAGDPGITFNPPAGVDYLWDAKSIMVEPAVLTTALDTFELTVDLLNIGINGSASVDVKIEQELPGGQREILWSGPVATLRSRNQTTFRLPVLRGVAGTNRLFLTVDPDGTVEELPDPAAEDNNRLVNENGNEGFQVFFLDNRVLTTYPPEYAIVTEARPQLTVSTTNAFSKGSSYVIELDTTALFNSPLLEREKFQNAGNILKWQPASILIPNTVYYWRVSVDSVSSETGYLWDLSSFSYEPGGERGWNQSHYWQFADDEYFQLQLNQNREFEFTDQLKNVWVRNEAIFEEGDEPEVFVNNKAQAEFMRWFRNEEGNVFVMVLEPVTSFFWANPPGGQYGAINPIGLAIRVFPFNTETIEDRASLMTFLEDVVPDGHYIFMYTFVRNAEPSFFPELWEADSLTLGRNIFSVVESQYPESEIRQLKEKGSVPYIVLYQKGVGPIEEEIAFDKDAAINLEYNFQNKLKDGKLTSTLIGPASEWRRLEWLGSGIADPASDSIKIQLSWLSADRSDTLRTGYLLDPAYDMSHIDATEFPYAFLELDLRDPSDARSAPQLENWRVLYEGRPEVVFNPTISYSFKSDTLMLGDSMHVTTAYENVSPYPAEGFRVGYTISSRTFETSTAYQNMANVGPGETGILKYSRRMQESTGPHSLLLELNPGNEKLEVHHFNNYMLEDFLVLGDEIAPVLDVTFDGRHLRNGDIVNASPEILIALRDDNNFAALDDPALIELYLKTPGSFEFTEIEENDPDRQFIPAELPNSSDLNEAFLYYRPLLAEDGIYSMRVLARDKNGNVPGSTFYEVTFEVLGNYWITPVLVNPVPARSYVDFELTLSGNSAPGRLSIEIFNDVGMLVREITASELGGLYVGTHTFRWDLQNADGGRLLSGVYFYQIRAEGQDGQLYRLTSNGSSDAQTGKLVIIN